MMRTFPTLRSAVSAALLTVVLGAGVVTTAQAATAASPAVPAGAQTLPVTPADWPWPPNEGRGDGPRWHDDGRGGHWDRGRRAHGGDDDWDDWRRRLRQERERCEDRRPLTPWGEWDWDDGECRWRH